MQDPAAETLGRDSLPALERKLTDLEDTVTARLKKQVTATACNLACCVFQLKDCEAKRHLPFKQPMLLGYLCLHDGLDSLDGVTSLYGERDLAFLQGFDNEQIECERYLNLRYDGTDVAMMTKTSSSEDTYEKVCSLMMWYK